MLAMHGHGAWKLLTKYYCISKINRQTDILYLLSEDFPVLFL